MLVEPDSTVLVGTCCLDRTQFEHVLFYTERQPRKVVQNLS